MTESRTMLAITRSSGAVTTLQLESKATSRVSDTMGLPLTDMRRLAWVTGLSGRAGCIDSMHTVINLFCILHTKLVTSLLAWPRVPRLLILTLQTLALGNLVTLRQLTAFLLHARSLSPSCAARAHTVGLRWSFLGWKYSDILPCFSICSMPLL